MQIEARPNGRSGMLTVCVLVVAVPLAIPVVPFLLFGELPGAEWLADFSRSPWLLGAAGCALLIADLLAPIPSTVVMTVLGAELGLFPGWAWSLAGLVTGNLLGYALGRGLLARWIAPRVAKDLEAPGVWLIMLSRPVPVLAEAATVAAGATGMPVWRFLAASAAANVLYAGALSANGVALLPDSLLGTGLVVAVAIPILAWIAYRAVNRGRL